MNTAIDLQYAAFVGIDWADRKHDMCLQAAGSSKLELSVLRIVQRDSRSGHTRYVSVREWRIDLWSVLA